MCGIVGYVGNKNCQHTLIDGLKKLEYRGYDSAGIAYVCNNDIKITKTVGRIKNLDNKVNYNDNSYIGIGHTRWATHGGTTSINAHPHNVSDITIVHNGIIENYSELKVMLEEKGYKFISETDTEVGCAYIDYLYNKDSKKDILSVLNKCSKDLIGSFAMAIMIKGDKDRLYVLKKDSPLIIGVGNEEMFIASSVNAFNKDVLKYVILEDYDYGVVSKDNVTIYNNGSVCKREFIDFDDISDVNDKKGYSHYMLKEINEQSKIIEKLNNRYLNNLDSIVDISKFKEIQIIACGSAYHAGIIGKYMIEEYSDINVNVYIASEYRYQKINYRDNTLVIAISQSGETADTIACIKKAHDNGIYTVGIVNVNNSTIARMVDEVIYTDAGVEIAVATTKGYLTQTYILLILCLKLIKDKDFVDNAIKDSKKIPDIIKKFVNMNYDVFSKKIYKNEDIFYIGRNIDYASMLEGTLKLKEISYIHAECYAAGELKHGSISLIEKDTPVVGLITRDNIASKTVSNIKEVKARGAYVILIVRDGLQDSLDKDVYDDLIIIDNVNLIWQPIISAIPMQMIAYNVAVLRNCDIDKPRNLAKSVTVE